MCVVIVAASVASFWWSVDVVYPTWFVRLDFGTVYLCRHPPWDANEGAVWREGAVWGPVWIGPTTLVFHPWTGKGTTASGVTIRMFPTWVFLLVAVIPTVLAWRNLRRPLPGHCRKCGYDLTGNVTGKCSECGAETEGDK